MYISCQKFDEHGLQLVSYFSDLFQSDKKKALIPFPLVMMVDPSLQGNRLQIKVIFIETLFHKDIELGIKFP